MIKTKKKKRASGRGVGRKGGGKPKPQTVLRFGEVGRGRLPTPKTPLLHPPPLPPPPQDRASARPACAGPPLRRTTQNFAFFHSPVAKLIRSFFSLSFFLVDLWPRFKVVATQSARLGSQTRTLGGSWSWTAATIPREDLQSKKKNEIWSGRMKNQREMRGPPPSGPPPSRHPPSGPRFFWFCPHLPLFSLSILPKIKIILYIF